MNEARESVSQLSCEIVLIGLRGSGKSTVGRALALHCHCVFVDLDELVIAEFAETNVRDIWDRHGEEAWRREEERLAVRTLTNWQANMILALGGGTVMIQNVRESLEGLQREDLVRVVYLRGEPGILLERLMNKEGDRPRLTDEDELADEVATVYRERDGVYLEVADVVIDLRREMVEETVGRIIDEFVDKYSESNQEK